MFQYSPNFQDHKIAPPISNKRAQKKRQKRDLVSNDLQIQVTPNRTDSAAQRSPTPFAAPSSLRTHPELCMKLWMSKQRRPDEFPSPHSPLRILGWKQPKRNLNETAPQPQTGPKRKMRVCLPCESKFQTAKATGGHWAPVAIRTRPGKAQVHVQMHPLPT
jgi:hypothetical protein